MPMMIHTTEKFAVLGSSTGETQALKVVPEALPTDSAGIGYLFLGGMLRRAKCRRCRHDRNGRLWGQRNDGNENRSLGFLLA